MTVVTDPDGHVVTRYTSADLAEAIRIVYTRAYGREAYSVALYNDVMGSQPRGVTPPAYDEIAPLAQWLADEREAHAWQAAREAAMHDFLVRVRIGDDLLVEAVDLEHAWRQAHRMTAGEGALLVECLDGCWRCRQVELFDQVREISHLARAAWIDPADSQAIRVGQGAFRVDGPDDRLMQDWAIHNDHAVDEPHEE